MIMRDNDEAKYYKRLQDITREKMMKQKITRDYQRLLEITNQELKQKITRDYKPNDETKDYQSVFSERLQDHIANTASYDYTKLPV